MREGSKEGWWIAVNGCTRRAVASAIFSPLEAPHRTFPKILEDFPSNFRSSLRLPCEVRPPGGRDSRSRSIPAAVERLLRATDEPALHDAWSEFLEEDSRLILHGARSLGGSHDKLRETLREAGIRDVAP